MTGPEEGGSGLRPSPDAPAGRIAAGRASRARKGRRTLRHGEKKTPALLGRVKRGRHPLAVESLNEGRRLLPLRLSVGKPHARRAAQKACAAHLLTSGRTRHAPVCGVTTKAAWAAATKSARRLPTPRSASPRRPPSPPPLAPPNPAPAPQSGTPLSGPLVLSVCPGRAGGRAQGKGRAHRPGHRSPAQRAGAGQKLRQP
jgi:hypothetical protein